nr:invertase inhibitor [Tanacetum cinerariifolium]
MTNKSFSFAKILLLFVLISNVYASKPYEFVNQVCHVQADVKFCSDVLKSDKNSKLAKDYTTLAQIAVNVAIKYSTRTRDHFQEVKTGPPGVLKSLKECIRAYNTVIMEFSVSFNENDECELVRQDILVAGDEAERCQRVVDDYGAHDSFITHANNVTLEFVRLEFGYWQWRLATLPFAFGGLGVYSVGDVLNYVFLASRLQSVGLQTKLIRHAGIVASGPTFDDALCVFNTSMETDRLSNPRDHAISCAGIIGIKHRHNVVRDTLVDICFRSGISASKEVDIGLNEGRDKPLRLADMLLYSWDGGLDVCVWISLDLHLLRKPG